MFTVIGLIGGNLVLFFNWQESHDMIMYLAYVALVKQIYFKDLKKSVQGI